MEILEADNPAPVKKAEAFYTLLSIFGGENLSNCEKALSLIYPSENKNAAELVLEFFGYTCSEPIPTNPTDSFFYTAIFNTIMKSAAKNKRGGKNLDILSVAEALSDDELMNFPLAPYDDPINIKNHIIVIVKQAIDKCRESPGQK